jgi:hypothetical protein
MTALSEGWPLAASLPDLVVPVKERPVEQSLRGWQAHLVERTIDLRIALAAPHWMLNRPAANL